MQIGKIHATVRKDLIPIFKDQLEEGSAYVFENLMVGNCDQSYKAAEHKFKLNFMKSTKVFKVTAPEIARYHFDFVGFKDILSAPDDKNRLLGKLISEYIIYYLIGINDETIVQYIHANVIFLCLDVIGHIVEKNEPKETYYF
jgi:hypothetical protein